MDLIFVGRDEGRTEVRTEAPTWERFWFTSGLVPASPQLRPDLQKPILFRKRSNLR
jgi:hypothetical protein